MEAPGKIFTDISIVLRIEYNIKTVFYRIRCKETQISTSNIYIKKCNFSCCIAPPILTITFILLTPLASSLSTIPFKLFSFLNSL
jgi:hypothetical protein